MLFHEGRKVGREQRFLLDIFGLLLSQIQGRMPADGIVWHGPQGKPTKVRLNPAMRTTERTVREVKEIVRAESPPRLILNDHCQVCEFRQQCYQQAVREDSISLLRGISENEVKRFARKGLFTVTQLAHTFRPRRKGTRKGPGSQKHHHALQAMAVRDKTVYILGTPQLPSSPVRIYIDMEGDPDENYVYLIGMIVVRGGTETRHSFWADGKEQEPKIFEAFLGEVAKYEDASVFCYGVYERVFLKRMRKQAKRKAVADRVLNALFNVLSVIYGYVYFPTYSKGLKDIGGCLGCSWSEPDPSGIQSIVWRQRWESLRNDEWKQKLTTYNLEDCAALRKVTEAVYSAIDVTSLTNQGTHQIEGQSVARVQEVERYESSRTWKRVDFVHEDFDVINQRAYFDYQRERVFVRSSRVLKKHWGRRSRGTRNRVRATKRVTIIDKKCPACGSSEIVSGLKTSRSEATCPIPRLKRSFDLVLTPSGVKRRVIEYRSSVHRCMQCRHLFVPERHVRLDKHGHGLKSWAMYQHVAHRLSLAAIQTMFEDVFGLHIVEIHAIKSQMADYYRQVYRDLLRKILTGILAHIDETEVKLQTGKGYVWAITNLEEVVYMYRPTREGDFLQDLLKDFHGVLVSDFYAAYDSIECLQQKCLIHLMRDMNQELLSNPYDEELRSITRPFVALLRAVVGTVDTKGLKRCALHEHKNDVDGFFDSLVERTFASEAAEALRSRLLKYRDKLFTFIDHDGVPWNNYNAENAIKRFAYYREVTRGMLREGGLSDYLVLLSIFQTCRYKGVSFLKFLVSGLRDINSFCEGKRSRRRWSAILLYPKGYVPLHVKNRKSRRASLADSPTEDSAAGVAPIPGGS
jgi:predicted RecB family nuclease